MPDKQIADIPEAFFEYKASLAEALFHLWTLPNQLVPAVLSMLKEHGVTLADVTWSKEPATFKDMEFTFNIQKLRAIIKTGMDSLTFIAVNPDWSEAPALLSLFDRVRHLILEIGKTNIQSQEIGLAMHVKPGAEPFSKIMPKLVNTKMLGSAPMYGISVYHDDGSSMVIDRSLRYDGAVFVRLHRSFVPKASFADIAKVLYSDEMQALALLGLEELLTGELKNE